MDLHNKRSYSPDTTLTAILSTTANQIQLANSAVMPSAPNTAVLRNDDLEIFETVRYLGIQGNTLTGVTRAIAGGDVPRQWPLGTLISSPLTATDVNLNNQNVSEINNMVNVLDKNFSQFVQRTRIMRGENIINLPVGRYYVLTVDVMFVENIPPGATIGLSIDVDNFGADGRIIQVVQTGDNPRRWVRAGIVGGTLNTRSWIHAPRATDFGNFSFIQNTIEAPSSMGLRLGTDSWTRFFAGVSSTILRGASNNIDRIFIGDNSTTMRAGTSDATRILIGRNDTVLHSGATNGNTLTVADDSVRFASFEFSGSVLVTSGNTSMRGGGSNVNRIAFNPVATVIRAPQNDVNRIEIAANSTFIRGRDSADGNVTLVNSGGAGGSFSIEQTTGTAASARRVNTNMIAENTNSATTNMLRLSGTTGTVSLQRSTSSKRYKIAIKDISDEVCEKVLELKPKSYIDRPNAERMAFAMTESICDKTGEQCKETYDKLIKDVEKIQRYGGLIAEDVHDLGLSEFVAYRDDGKTPDGIAYSTLWTLLIPIVKKQKEEIDELKRRLDVLEKP